MTTCLGRIGNQSHLAECPQSGRCCEAANISIRHRQSHSSFPTPLSSRAKKIIRSRMIFTVEGSAVPDLSNRIALPRRKTRTGMDRLKDWGTPTADPSLRGCSLANILLTRDDNYSGPIGEQSNRAGRLLSNRGWLRDPRACSSVTDSSGPRSLLFCMSSRAKRFIREAGPALRLRSGQALCGFQRLGNHERLHQVMVVVTLLCECKLG